MIKGQTQTSILLLLMQKEQAEVTGDACIDETSLLGYILLHLGRQLASVGDTTPLSTALDHAR